MSGKTEDLFMDVGHILRRIRKAKQLTLQEVSDKVGGVIQPGHLSRIEREGLEPSGQLLYILTTALGISLDSLFREACGGAAADQKSPGAQLVPVIDWGLAESFDPDVDPVLEYVATPYPVAGNAYALRVSGESMQSAQAESYPDGSIIIVVREKNMRNNTPIIVKNGAETPVFRKLIVDGTGAFLKALNPQYPSANLHDEAVFCGTVKFCIQIA